MGEKNKSGQVGLTNLPSSSSHKSPVSMKLFAIGDLNRIPSFSMSRICSVRFVHLSISKILEDDLAAVSVAVKMQGAKRTLRSAEFDLSSTGLFDSALDISVSLQYPHYLKRRDNILFVMLQRRKRYKSRRILGYKTLAVGTIDMSEVLQRSIELELVLYADPKDKKSAVAQISMASLSTQPANAGNEATSEDEEFTSEMSDSEGDVDILGEGRKHSRKSGRFHRQQGNFKQKVISLLKKFKTPEEIQNEFDAENVAELETRDKNAMLLEEDLLDELDFDSDSGPEYFDNISLQSTPRPHLSPYFKPGRSVTHLLSPVEQSTTSKAEKSEDRNTSDSHPDNLTDEDASNLRVDEPQRKPRINPSRDSKPPFTLKESRGGEKKEILVKLERKVERTSESGGGGGAQYGQHRDLAKKAELRKFSQTIPVEPSPRKILLEQLDLVFPSPDEDLPPFLTWVNGNHSLGKSLQERLHAVHPPAICAWTTADLKACFALIANRIQKMTHLARHQLMIKVVLCGGDEFVNAVLRAYVELFSDKPLDLQNHIKFIFIPLGESALAHNIQTTDSYACSLFDESRWPLNNNASQFSEDDWQNIIGKIYNYAQTATYPTSLPIAQAMINFKSHGISEAESSQNFIPFLSHVRVHSLPVDTSSDGPEDFSSAISTGMGHLGSPVGLIGTPVGIHAISATASSGDLQQNQKSDRDFSPPNSPVVQALTLPKGESSFQLNSDAARELQLDYWMSSTNGGISADEKNYPPERDLRERKKSDIIKPNKDAPSAKTSIKANFKYLYITRPTHVFTLLYATKEKKIQIMRALGKKTKESEVRTVVVEGMSRLICRICKANSSGMKVVIDGCDWSNINFFQLSPSWHTTVKSFPLLVHQNE